MKAKELTPLQTLRRSLGMVVQAAPRELRNLALLNLLTGVGPSISLYLGKIIIDEATRLAGQGTATDGFSLLLSQSYLLWIIGTTVVLNLVVDSVDSVGTSLFAALRDRVQGYVKGRVLTKIAHFDDIALFEMPDLLNLLHLTEKGLERIQRLSFIVAATLVGVFIFIPSILLSSSIAWWVPLLLLSASIPSILVEMKHHKKSWRVEETQAGLTREMDIYARMITGEAYAKEIRLFSLQSVLLGHWRDLFDRFFNTMANVRREGAIAVLTWALVGGLGTAFPYVFVIAGVLQGTYTLGDLALYTGIILQVRQSLYILIGNTGDIYDVALATAPIFQLFDLQPQLPNGSDPVPRSPVHRSSGIQFQHVSFLYPGSDKPTLTDITFTVHPGEMIALVGENGAGKTTLAKLLCRLYDPSEGIITWNGMDYRSLHLDDLRSHIGVVMQDYARFPATLRQNVGWGYRPDLHHDDQIHAVLKDAGIDYIVHDLDRGLETPLGKQLEDGVDLSGGQWQRLAIARALLRLDNTQLLVFDEPTAALDPKNEHDIYRIFKTISEGRMSVVVSHRLALAKMADRILVLEHGRIVEAGTHEELMQRGDRYYTMFTRQASSYL